MEQFQSSISVETYRSIYFVIVYLTDNRIKLHCHKSQLLTNSYQKLPKRNSLCDDLFFSFFVGLILLGVAAWSK